MKKKKGKKGRKKKGGGGGGVKKKQSTVKAYIGIKPFHTHWNNHKSYKIMHILITTWQSEKHKYCHDNQKSTSTVMTIRKAQNNTVNTYINTKKHFTHSHLLYDYTQTPAHMVTHRHLHTHTHLFSSTRARTHTHTLTQLFPFYCK